LVRAVFLRLVTAEGTRAIATSEELGALSAQPGEVQGMIDYLAEARLLVMQSGEGGQGATVEIVHESLIQSWPQLRRWLDENHDDVLFLERLRASATQWRSSGYATGLLWRGEAATDAERRARRHRDTLPELQRSYLEAVIALAQRNRRNRRLAVIGAMGFLSVLAVASASVALVIRDAQQETERQARAYAGALDDIRALTDSLGDKDRDYAQRVREILAQADAAGIMAMSPDHITASPRLASSPGAPASETAVLSQQITALQTSLAQMQQTEASAQATIAGHEQQRTVLETRVHMLESKLQQSEDDLQKLKTAPKCAGRGLPTISDELPD
jgi:hypothetical protein